MSVKKSKDEYVDVREALDSIVRSQGVWRDLLHQISSSIEGTKQAKTIAEHLNVAPKETSDWQKFQLGVSEEALYDDDQLVTNILHSMVKLITCFHDSWTYEFFSRNFLCFLFLNSGHSEKHKEFEKSST